AGRAKAGRRCSSGVPGRPGGNLRHARATGALLTQGLGGCMARLRPQAALHRLRCARTAGGM
ncbi:MAG: hypothetical protein AVDCRST_MAG39-59, partial [uncultured Sphingomonadaceae bacterium]